MKPLSEIALVQVWERWARRVSLSQPRRAQARRRALQRQWRLQQQRELEDDAAAYMYIIMRLKRHYYFVMRAVLASILFEPGNSLVRPDGHA